MTESDRSLGQRWFEEVWNQGRREAIAEMLAPDAVIHDGGIDTAGPAGFQSFFDRISATLSELHIDVDDTIAASDAEGDKLCVRWSCTARHTGDGLGLAPTGRTIDVTGICILRVANGKIVEGWQNWDMLGMMEQINGLRKSATYIGAPS
jgi:predicted ester cyclase